MSLATAELPADPAALRAFALACQSELKAAETAVQLKALEIEKLRFQLAKLRRMQFGRSSERITRQIAQLEFQLEELETGAAEDTARVEAAEPPAPTSERVNKPERKPLPDHLPRQDVVHQPAGDGACTCPDCGGSMAKLGEDVTEVLDYVPGHFQVIRHVRPQVCLLCVRRHHAGSGSSDADATRPCHTGDAGASVGGKILRPSAALPSERDLCARGTSP